MLDKIRLDIENILYLQHNADADAKQISYILHKNIVILSGVVTDKHKKQLIRQAILNLKGIKTVIDRLCVKNSFKNSLPALLK